MDRIGSQQTLLWSAEAIPPDIAGYKPDSDKGRSRGVCRLLAVAGLSNILDRKAISPYDANIIVGLRDRFRDGDADA